MERTYSKKSRYIIVLVFCIACMVILNQSFVFFADGNMHEKIVMVLNVLCLVLIPVAFAFVKPFTRLTDYLMYRFACFADAVKRHRKKIGIYGLAVVVAYLLSLFAEYCVVSRVLKTPANASRQIMIFAIFLLCVVIYAFRERAGKRPELFFVATALVLGGMLILVSPATLGVMVDDETHYARMLAEANFLDGTRLSAEHRLTIEYQKTMFEKFAYDRESRAAYYDDINRVYESKEVAMTNVYFHGIWSPCYIPSAIGTVLGQGLGISFVHVFMLGKFFNLLFYVMLFYFAIKKIRYGKVLLATIGLLPTNIFMASNYSYDPWLIGFVALSYAYFFYEVQTPEQKLSTKNVVLMLVFLLLGCLPKAVYCVLGLPFLFMPKQKFASKKQRLWYYMPVLVAGLALAGTFLIPALLHGVGTGDVRGGEGINATEQLANILHNPADYMRVLLHFLKSYLSVDNAENYLQTFFYFGTGTFTGVAIVVLWVVAVLDRSGDACMTPAVRISGVVASLAAVAACATVMYIVYTPVGSEEIFGCQGRYILPAVFPFLMSVVPDRVRNEINPNVFVIVPLTLLSGTFMYNIYNLCISLY